MTRYRERVRERKSNWLRFVKTVHRTSTTARKLVHTEIIFKVTVSDFYTYNVETYTENAEDRAHTHPRLNDKERKELHCSTSRIHMKKSMKNRFNNNVKMCSALRRQLLQKLHTFLLPLKSVNRDATEKIVIDCYHHHVVATITSSAFDQIDFHRIWFVRLDNDSFDDIARPWPSILNAFIDAISIERAQRREWRGETE